MPAVGALYERPFFLESAKYARSQTGPAVNPMSTVEIRNYEGDGSDLAELIGRTWRTAFTGKMWFPLWDHAYLSWRLLDERGGGREFLVSAYKGSQLVGCLLAEPLDLNIRGKHVRGTLSSWLSVDPENRIPNLAMRMVEGLRKRHQEHGVSISIGCTSADPKAPTRRFWDSLAQRRPEDFHFFGPIKFWTRVLDPAAVAAAGLNRFEQVGPRFARLMPTLPALKPPVSAVREYRPSDLDRCLSWVRTQSEMADIYVRWSAERLDLQLNHPYTRTLVLDEGAGAGGFLNYYCIDWSGARVIRVAVIDLFAGSSGFGGHLALVKTAERRMRAEGVQLALMMDSSASPPKPLWAAGFVPLPPNVDLFCYFPEPGLQLGSPVRYHLLFT